MATLANGGRSQKAWRGLRFKGSGFRVGVAPIVRARRSLAPPKNDDICFFITRDFNRVRGKENGTIPF